jgi:peptide/nickel transport system permease protein
MVILKDWKFIAGLTLVLALVLFSVIGMLFVDKERTRIGTSPFNQEPSWEHPLGTDNVGRDIFALMVYGIPPTLQVGLLAGGISTVVGTALGMTSGYFGGRLDDVIRSAADIALVIPSLAILVTIAAYLRRVTIPMTALIVAVLAWAGPTRSIRTQTLSMRERQFIPLAKLSAASDLETLFLEIFPNLLPYIAAGFVGSISGGILASVGIQLLGLGPLLIPNLGMILQFAFNAGALFQGMWWWWGAPAFALILLFIGLFLISMSLDQFSNPRLRRSEKTT